MKSCFGGFFLSLLSLSRLSSTSLSLHASISHFRFLFLSLSHTLSASVSAVLLPLSVLCHVSRPSSLFSLLSSSVSISSYQRFNLGAQVDRFFFAGLSQRGIHELGVQVGTAVALLWLAANTSAAVTLAYSCSIMLAFSMADEVNLCWST